MGVSLIAQPASGWGPYFTNGLILGGVAEFIAGHFFDALVQRHAVALNPSFR
jgi:hypothetical protein